MTKVITAEDLSKFVELTGDDNRLHVDEQYAKNTAFKKPVVHGMLGASFISTIIGTKLPGDGALWFSQTIDFLLPVRINDEITIKAEVTGKNERERYITLDIKIFNQHNQVVTKGISKVKIVDEIIEEKKNIQEDKVTRRTALIIGASGGFGSEISRTLAKDNYDLILHYNSNSVKAKELKSELDSLGGRNITIKSDLKNESSIIELKENILRFVQNIDVIIISISPKLVTTPFDAVEYSSFTDHMKLNIEVPFHLAKHLVSLMKKDQSPSIILMSSMVADQPLQGSLAYSVAKAALNGLTKGLAIELAGKGIRVNAVSPGMADTDLISEIPLKSRLMVEAKTLRGRLATPKDIASSVKFLASKESDYMTGEILRINGGQFMI